MYVSLFFVSIAPTTGPHSRANFSIEIRPLKLIIAARPLNIV